MFGRKINNFYYNFLYMFAELLIVLTLWAVCLGVCRYAKYDIDQKYDAIEMFLGPEIADKIIYDE